MNGRKMQWRSRIESFSFGGWPKNLVFLPMLLLLNHFVAVFEVGFAIDANSLGLFTHGSHLIFNGIILTGVVTSLFVNWRETGRYSLTYVETVAKTNFLVGLGLLVNTLVVAYLTARDFLQPTTIDRGELLYLVPVPALLLDLLGAYLLLHDDPTHAEVEAERARCRKMTARNFYWHMLANAVGSVATIGATLLVQRFDWTAADGSCSAFLALVMLGCALHLLKESAAMIVAARTQPSVFVVGYHANDILDGLAGDFRRS